MAFALQLRKKHGKTSVRVGKTSVWVGKTSVKVKTAVRVENPPLG
jgi:acyl-CoA hydrolase